MKQLNVLVACEESQTVCKAFRALGHMAYSCDLQRCSGERPEWHIHGDVLSIIRGGCEFRTQDGTEHTAPQMWDIIIAHPPCTYLTVTGNRWFNVERYGQSALDRLVKRDDAAEFFMMLAFANAKHIAIENPVGYMSTFWRKPEQIIQPWMFGHPTTKKTCLWLKNLPELQPTNIVEVDTSDVYEYVAANGRIKHDSRNRSRCRKEDRAKHRSKTFQGIASAMARQWSDYVMNDE